MSDLTQNMQTYCVGRLLIDLPKGATWTTQASGAQLGNMALSVTTGVTQQQYDELVEHRWQEVLAIKTDNNGKAYLRPSERIATPEGGAVFVYEYEHVDGLAEDDETVVQQLFHQAEGYLWRDGTLFKITPSLNSKDAIAKLFPRLHARAADEIPSRPGLCLSGAFVDGYYDLASGDQEEVSWGFTLPRNLGVVVRHGMVWEPEQPMLERRREADRESAGLIARMLADPGVVAGRKEYRAATRVVGEMDGEEYVMGGTEGKGPQEFKTNVGGEWNFVGRGTPTPLPSVNLGMDTTYLTSRKPSTLGDFPNFEDVSGGPTEAEFFEIWDAIIESVRFRPGALTPPSGGKPLISPSSPVTSTVVSKPGTNDYALEEFLTGLSPSQDWMDKL
ncbi:T6SS immunity protein Tli4 family protein [Pseudomonas frederiksbergensis]|nr:T6SS immunity protein Tli4 family protein [Pseudomonas frederiksbergensis]